MELRCKACGAVLAAPPIPGTPTTCTFCGAPQQPLGSAPVNPYGGPPAGYGQPPAAFGPPPGGFGAPPGGYGAPPQGFGVPPGGFDGATPRIGPPPGTGAVGAIVAVMVVLMMAGGIMGFVLMRRPSAGTAASSSSSGMPLAQLATLSLKLTPDAMAKITGVTAKGQGSDTLDMDVPLADKTWTRMTLDWDTSDPSHVKEVYLHADAPPSNDAAIRQRLATILGRRLDKDTRFNFDGASFDYDSTSARAECAPKFGSITYAHWKEKVDALWDVLRSGVLGQSVTISDTESRDWLQRGYTLTALGAIDPGIDVDHAAAAMLAAFPAVATEVSGGLRNKLAVDSPWFGDAEVNWEDAKGATMGEVYLYPPPQAAQKFPNQADIETCVQAAVGGKPRIYEGDHLKGDHSTDWTIPAGGEIRTYEHLVHITLSSHFTAHKMPRGEYTKLLDALDGCSKKK